MLSPRAFVCTCLAAVAIGCTPAVEPPMPPTPEERQVIAEEVGRLFDGIAEATNALDLDRLLGFYRQSVDLTYVANGRVNRSYESYRQMVDAQFGGLIASDLEWLSSYVDVLSRDVAVVTATFEFTATLPSGQTAGSAGSYTCIYVLTDGRWQIQHSSHTFPPAAG